MIYEVTFKVQLDEKEMELIKIESQKRPKEYQKALQEYISEQLWNELQITS